jgi:hypothetical protein
MRNLRHLALLISFASACASPPVNQTFRQHLELAQLRPECSAPWGKALSLYASRCSEWLPAEELRPGAGTAAPGFPEDEARWVVTVLRRRIQAAAETTSPLYSGEDFFNEIVSALLDMQLTHIGAIEAQLANQQRMHRTFSYGAKGTAWVDGHVVSDLPEHLPGAECAAGVGALDGLDPRGAYLQVIPGSGVSAIAFHIESGSQARQTFSGWWRFVFLPLPDSCLSPLPAAAEAGGR